MNADSLSMPEEEFKRYMSGEATPHDPTKQYTCEGLRLMHKNLESLAELRSRQEKLMVEAMQLQKDMVDFKKSFKNEIEAVLARTPLTIKPRKIKVDLDADAVGAEHLPPPLLPQIIGDDAKETQCSTGGGDQPAVANTASSLESHSLVNKADITANSPAPTDPQLDAESMCTTYQDTESVEQKDLNSVTDIIISNDSTNNNRVLSSTDSETGCQSVVISNKDNGNSVSE